MADQNGASASASQSSDPPPPLVALFLIKFDLKVGYVHAIVLKRRRRAMIEYEMLTEIFT